MDTVLANTISMTMYDLQSHKKTRLLKLNGIGNVNMFIIHQEYQGDSGTQVICTKPRPLVQCVRISPDSTYQAAMTVRAWSGK